MNLVRRVDTKVAPTSSTYMVYGATQRPESAMVRGWYAMGDMVRLIMLPHPMWATGAIRQGDSAERAIIIMSLL